MEREREEKRKMSFGEMGFMVGGGRDEGFRV